EVAAGHGGGHFRDVADLACEVGGHGVHVVREVLPCARYARHVGLPAQVAFGAYFLGHAGHFGSEGGELIHHGIDSVLELRDLALPAHRDLPGEVAIGHGGGDLCDVADLAGEVGGHGVHIVREVLPRAGNPFHIGLPAELALGAHLARHPRDLRGE